MSNSKDGGQAFPVEDIGIHGSYGMTLRDYFAAKAMQGLLSGGGYFEKFADIATDSYALADVMIKAREEL